MKNQIKTKHMKIKLLIALLIAIFINFAIAMVINLILHTVWPSAPFWFILVFALLIALLLVRFLTKVANNNANPEAPGVLAANKWVWMLGIFVGALFGAFSTNSQNTAQVTFDNGTTKEVKLFFIDRTKEEINVIIKPDSLYEAEMPVGVVKFKLNGKDREIVTTSGEGSIFNIDTAHTYIKTEIMYGKEDANFNPKMETIKEEFFKADVDYYFEAPEQILSKRGRDKTKTVLYRMKDVIKGKIK